MLKNNKGIELLRIFSMLMIISLHFFSHGKGGNVIFGSFEYFFQLIIRSLSYVGVNCFVLITGYFMVNKEIRVSKYINIWGQVFFYSLLSIILAIVIPIEISKEKIILSFFPITTNKYWFISAYLLLMIYIPFLNIIIRNLNKKKLRKVLLLLAVVYSIVPTFLFWSKSLLTSGTDIIWFIVLYFLGAYIRKYNDFDNFFYPKAKHYIYIYIYIMFCLITFFLEFISIYILRKFSYTREIKIFLYNNSPFILGASIYIFLFFKRIGELYDNKINNKINNISQVAFGVYLFHDNDIIRKYMWTKINPLSALEKGKIYYIIYYVIIIIGIYFIGFIIEWTRKIVINYIKSLTNIIRHKNN